MGDTKSSQTKQRKTVKRSLAISLAIACVIMTSGLIGTVAYYMTAINQKNMDYDNYVSSHSHTNGDYDLINTLYENMKTPAIVNAWKSADNRPATGAPYFSIQGYAVNVGGDPIRDCRLHVVANRSSENVIDAYVGLGTVNGQSRSNYIDATFYYNGSALTTWSVLPEWTF